MVVRNRRAAASVLLVYIIVAGLSSAVTYFWVMGMVTSHSQQAAVQLDREAIHWNLTSNALTLVLRNTGDVSVTVTSLGVRQAAAGTMFDTVQTSTIIERQATQVIEWTGTGLTVTPQTPYILRVTCSTGFPYELTSTTPAIS
jgi:hypothetical protein